MNTHPSLRRLALIALGITAIAFPVAASITATYVVGWVLIVAGSLGKTGAAALGVSRQHGTPGQ